MKILLQNIVYSICLITTILSAQNLTTQEMLEFYPHHMGDIWSYLWVYYDPISDFGEGGREYKWISQDTIINDTTYWQIESESISGKNIYFERVDTLTGNVLRIQYSNPYEINCVDNVYADVGDTVIINNNYDLLYCNALVVLSFRDTMINNITTTIRKVIGLPDKQLLYFARNIGMLGSGENYWIDSANVNGNIFSNITDIKVNSEPIKKIYILNQNYPNPFNPITTKEYSLPKSAFVTIKIYDYLGREIITLVDEKKSSGSYSMQFNGSNLASGIYFYKLQIEKEFTNTKKMILLK